MPNNIIGESFKPYVEDQIKTRQKKLRLLDNREPDLLKYINNKTSWIRLSSGVNVTADKAKELGAPTLSGNTLAQSSVLFSARKYTNFTQNNKPEEWNGQFTAGVGYNLPNPSYGYTPSLASLSPSSNYGLVPPAGITSANIKPLNQGSLREATVQITCHNAPQFKIIEALYLRLGYSMLLEWGHTLWYDNKGTLRSDLPDWLHSGFILGHYTQDLILENLEKQREYTCGNYDGFFGRVTNFSWNFRPDGGYDITLNLRAIGDVIESLKVNINAPSADSTLTSANESGEALPPVVANKNKSTLHKILFAIAKELEIQQNNGRSLDGFNAGGKTSLQTAEIIRITKNNSQFDLGKANYQDPNEIWDKANNILTYQEGYMAIFSKITADPDESDSGGNFYYIKLGTILRIIESFLLKYDTSREKNGTYNPLFYIDHDFDTNICLTIPRQMGLNPHICLLPPSSITGSSASATAGSKTYIKYVYTKYGFGTFEDSYFTKTISTATETEVDPTRTILLPPEEDAWSSDPNKYDGVSVIISGSDWRRSGYTTYSAGDDYSNPAVGGAVNQVILYHNPDEATPTTYTPSPDQIPQAGQRNNLGGIKQLFRIENYPFLGKFMHILVNLDFIASILSNNIDSEGKVSVLNFLQALVSGISTATGEINNFSVTYDEIKNLFSIRDNNIPPEGYKYLNQIKPELKIKIIPTQFNVNLLRGNDGSFVKDLTIKSELTNEFATQITVGAQANGNKVGEDSTALSKLNIGFEDRILPKKSSYADDQASESAETTKSPDTVYAEQLESYSNLKVNIDGGDVTEEDITNNTQSIVDLYKYHVGYFTQNGEIPGAGFIPINLQLTTDGLSGPRLFETYTINDEILPTNYRNNIKFIIKGINHNIDINGWTTSLESFSAPRRDVLTPHKTLEDPLPKGGGGTTTPPTGGGETIPSDNSTVSTEGLSAIRKRIIEVAQYWESQKIQEEGGNDQGFNNDDFENQMRAKGVGWWKGAAWCNFFTTLCYKTAYVDLAKSDSTIDSINKKHFNDWKSKTITSGYCPTTYDNFKAKGLAEPITPNTQIYPGDMVTFNNTGDQYHDHIGIVIWYDKAKRLIGVIEGNSGPRGQSKVKLNTHRLDEYVRKSKPVGVIRPIENIEAKFIAPNYTYP